MKNKIILIQPTMGISGEFVKHIPLSLLYVASGLVKNNFEVSIIDNRVKPKVWKKDLKGQLNDQVLFVGLTVMSGSPIANAIEVSRFVKSVSDVPVVWGGAHPTVRPHQILEKDFVDFTVSGSGLKSSLMLSELLAEKKSYQKKDLERIPGLGFRDERKIISNPAYRGFEHVHYRDIPYDLIKDFSVYGQMGSKEKIFPIFSAYGCVYKCAFCISPHLYRDFERKWVPLSADEVMGHIKFLQTKYRATEIYFYDDDSFIDLNHIGSIIKEANKEKLNIKMSFRGARVNEILKMDKGYLDDLAAAGTHILHIGIESGSQRILDLFKKGIKTDDIVSINRKLADNKKIIAAYNWIVGTPTETIEDIAKTRRLILKLIDENPRCFIFQPNKFRPIPGTDLFNLAKKHGYAEPETLEGWINEELESDKVHPWYTRRMIKIIKMLQVTSYFIDFKPKLLLVQSSLKNRFITWLCDLYRPIARYRFRNGISAVLVEYLFYKYFVGRHQKIKK